MSMPGLKINVLRLIGKGINVIALFGVLIANFFLSNNFLFASIAIALGVLLVFVQFFIEADFWDDHRIIFIILIIAITYAGVILNLVSLEGEGSFFMYFYFGVQYFLAFYQQYTLSISKNEKIFFVVCLAILEVVLGITAFSMGFILLIIVMALLFVSAVMTLVAEQILKKKKLFNYI